MKSRSSFAIVGLAQLAVILLAGCGNNESSQPEKSVSFFTSHSAIPPFDFTDQDGQRFNQDSLKGKVYVANFFFASCPSICPKMTAALEEVQADLAQFKNFRIVSHSLDPVNDSVQALKVYAIKHGAKAGTWYFLTGDKADIYGLAEDSYFNTAKYGDGTPEGIVHNPLLILVDRHGVVEGYYDSQEPAEVKKLIRSARKLLES